MLLKKILLGTVASAMAFTICASTANAAEPCGVKPYVALRTGLAMLKNHIDKDAWAGSFAVGTQLDEFRVEAEYTYRDKIDGMHQFVKHKVGTQSLMINGYYDIPTDMALHPFVNLGIGSSRIHISEMPSYSDTSWRFSWGGGAGLAYDITERFAFDVGYRFLDLGRNIKSNEFYGGLRYSF